MSQSWISLHVFYYGDQNDLLIKCLAPLIDDLRSQKLIQRSFFIRYWMEGSHIRLRLLPAAGADEERIKRIAEQAITSYLKRRPALFVPDPQRLAPIYKEMFISEYGEEKWIKQYGEHGTMPLRANNSFHYIEYEREYGRYGGVDGVELAEWHFEQSSDIILNLLREVNVSVPSILLGTSVQLFLPLFYGFFATDQAVAEALDDYIKFWQSAQGDGWSNLKRSQADSYNKHYLRMASDIQQRILAIKEYMTHEHTPDQLTPIEYAWKAHILELRQRVDTLLIQGKLRLENSASMWQSARSERESQYRTLLGSYVHMTNNRLGVSIFYEVYLSYLLKRSLEDLIQNQRVQEATA